MDIFINEFLKNPAGKGSAILNVSALQDQYRKRYDNICKKIIHKTFSIKDDIYILVNIPSSVDGIFYDVLVKFNKTRKSLGKSITDMPMQLFSNSPSFLYTYANAYVKQGVFIKECRKKLSSKMLSDIAKTRNPYGVLSYDFSIYAALFYIVNNGYTSIEDLKINNFIRCSLGNMLGAIKNADTLQKNRKIQKDYNRQIELEKIKKSKNNIGKVAQENDSVKTTETKVRTIKNVKGNKSVGHNKKVKKI